MMMSEYLAGCRGRVGFRGLPCQVSSQAGDIGDDDVQVPGRVQGQGRVQRQGRAQGKARVQGKKSGGGGSGEGGGVRGLGFRGRGSMLEHSTGVAVAP